MPTRRLPDETPVVEFDPQLEISPFALFRRLKDGRSPRLVDVRRAPGEFRLRGAQWAPGEAWRPEDDADVVLFDDDGERAVAWARRLQEQGFENVRALFGGLDLYEFALDPEVVGAETFLEHRVESAPAVAKPRASR